MKTDRIRHEQLAQQRLEELRKRRAQGKLAEEDIPVVHDGDITSLQVTYHIYFVELTAVGYSVGSSHHTIILITFFVSTFTQEAVLNQLEARHTQERVILQELLDGTPNEDLLLWAEASSEVDRQDKLTGLKQKRSQIPSGME